MAEIKSILLTDEERDDCTPTIEQLEAYLATPDDSVAASLTKEEKRLVAKCLLYGENIAKEQLKKTLISVGKESKRMDGTPYLVPDYVEYRKALKEVGLK